MVSLVAGKGAGDLPGWAGDLPGWPDGNVPPVDEPKETLGSAIKLPPWYEPQRAEIVAALPPLA